MKSIKLREQAGAGQGLPKSEFAHASRVALWPELGGSLPGSEVDYSGVLWSIFPLRFQCCGDMSRVVDYPDHGGHESREPLSIFAIVCAELVIH